MKPNSFAGAFILACAGIAAVALVGYDPEPPRMSGSSSTALPPRAWPDYSVNGPGFTAPDMTDGGLIAYGYQLVARTFGAIGPEVADPAMRFAGDNLACQNCHLDGGTNRTGLPLVGVFKIYPKFLARDLNTCRPERSEGPHRRLQPA